MRKIIIESMNTLDGVLQSPSESEATSDNFKYACLLRK